MEGIERKEILIEVVPGAIIAAPLAVVLSLGHNFVFSFLIFYFGIWFVVFVILYDFFFIKRKIVERNERKDRG